MKFKQVLMVGYVPENLKPEDWERIDRLTEKKILVPKDSPQILQYLPSTDCLLVKLGATIDKEMIDRADNLEYVGMFGTGVGRIDLSHAASKGIAVCNVAGYSTEGVAEFVFAVILEHVREVERAKRQARDGDYSEATYSGTELKGKTFGVVGLGRIGSRVAEMALNGFGEDVRYWSKIRKPEIEKKGIRYQKIEDLIKESEFISLHLEYNEQTKDFLNEDRIKLIKPGAVVVNLAPMEIVKVGALLQRLAAGDMTFILDHSDELTAEQAKQLAKYKNCVMYPPIAYTTKEATALKQTMFVDNMENYLNGRPSNKVN
jgi:phosphoglycerate dehydrogenase-like enzyme